MQLPRNLKVLISFPDHISARKVANTFGNLLFDASFLSIRHIRLKNLIPPIELRPNNRRESNFRNEQSFRPSVTRVPSQRSNTLNTEPPIRISKSYNEFFFRERVQNMATNRTTNGSFAWRAPRSSIKAPSESVLPPPYTTTPSNPFTTH